MIRESPRGRLRATARSALAIAARWDRLASLIGATLAAASSPRRLALAREALWGLTGPERLALGLDLVSDAALNAHGDRLEDVLGAVEQPLEIALTRALDERLPRGLARCEDVLRRALAASRGAFAVAAPALAAAALNGGTVEAVNEACERLLGLPETNERSLEYGLRVADAWRAQLTAHGVPWEGARVLEIGPGYTLACGIALVCEGAARYVAVDMFPILSRSPTLYARLRRLLADRSGGDGGRALARFDALVGLSGEEVALAGPELEVHCPVDAACMPFPDASFDVVLSLACFEHLRDPAGVARECRRVLAPGGVGLHQVDMRDHRDFAAPHEFLVYEDDEWSEMFRTEPFAYTNRLRQGEVLEVFRAAGHKEVELSVALRRPVPPDLRLRLASSFRGMSDEELSALSGLVVVRR